MRTEIFDNRLDQLEGEDINIATFASYNIRVEKLQSGKYKLRISKKDDDKDLFENDKGIRFEVHFQEDVKVTNDAGEVEDKGSMVGLFFFNGTRGWYIDSAECERGMEVVLAIGRMLNNRFYGTEMMKKVFDTANV